jgi:hypothetical protein
MIERTTTEKVTFTELNEALAHFGYAAHRAGSRHVVFKHPGGRLDIVLPRLPDGQIVSRLHLQIVEKTLRDESIVDPDEFVYYLKHGKPPGETIRKGDRLIWTVPSTGREVRVVAAAGEMDGLVIIKQNGALSPCPVDQLRKHSS